MTVAPETRDDRVVERGLSELGRRAQNLYERLHPQVETEENIGKLIILDVDSGDYEISEEKTGIPATHRLQARHPGVLLYGLRIGYNATDAIGGVLERTAP